MAADDEKKPSKKRGLSLEQYLNGGLLFARTAASKALLGNGNPHLSIQAETVLRFMQQFRDPKLGEQSTSTALTEVSRKNLLRLRKAMDRASPPAPKWIRREKVQLPSFDAAQPPLVAEWFVPPNATPADNGLSVTTILYLHGGAYLAGSIRSHERLVSFIANASRARALVVEYSLAPEQRWPTQLKEALAAFAWLVDVCNVDPQHIVIMGDSAGGNLSLVTTLALVLLNNPDDDDKNADQHKEPTTTNTGSSPHDLLPRASRKRDLGSGGFVPGAVVLLSPWVNMDVHSDESKRYSTWAPNADTDYLPSRELDSTNQFLPDGSPPSLIFNPLISPAFADPELLARLPPILVSMGGAEQLAGQINWFCDSVEKAKPGRLQRRSYPGMPHVFHFFGSLMPEAREAISDIGQFVQHILGSSPQLKARL